MLYLLFIVTLSIPFSISAQIKITTEILEHTWQKPDTVIKIILTDVTSSAEATTTIINEIHKGIPDSLILPGYLERFEKFTET